MILEPGDKIDRYVVEGMLGQGGMAIVYRVRHRTLGTRHALKLLSFLGTELQDRLVQEGRVQAHLRHPNVVSVSDVIEHHGMPALVMEYIEGPSLDVFLHHYRPTLPEAISIFRGILAGVGAAHAQGLVHRDLKPGNVMLQVTARGAIPRVTDFGLVKVRTSDHTATRSGTTMGTPVYMAPEQIRDASTVDRRADLYSLGVMLYELCCGQVPYNETDLIKLFERVVSGDRAPPIHLCPGISEGVVATIDSLMELEPDHRVLDCAGALSLLDGVELGDLTFNNHFRPGEALPEPTPMPETLSNARLAVDAPGMATARGLVTDLQAATTNPTPKRELDVKDTVTLAFDLDPEPRRNAWVAGLIGAFLLLVALLFFTATGGGFLVAALWPFGASEVVEPVPLEPREPVPIATAPAAPTPAAPAPAAPAPAAPSPAPDVAPVELRVPEPAIQPRPVPTPIPTAAPSPAPTLAPSPVLRPAPAPLSGRVILAPNPDVEELTLVGPAGEFGVNDAIPPGSYRLDVSFRGERVQRMGKPVTIRAGESTRIVCNTGYLRCTVR